MLEIQTIREQEANDKWHKLTKIFAQRNQEIAQADEDKISHSLSEAILMDIKKIEYIENTIIFKTNKLELVPEIKEKLIRERDECRVEASLKLLAYIVNKKEIEFKQKIDIFFQGINSINAILLYSGDTLYCMEKQKIESFIRNLYTFLAVWQDLCKKINDSSIFILHEKSLKLIYSSLYILENTYSFLQNKKQPKDSSDAASDDEQPQAMGARELDWKQESKHYDDLLADIDEWAEEEWTEEEQEAYERTMANL